MSAGHPRVLVVDDVEEQRDLLHRLFERAGCEVDAVDGSAAAAQAMLAGTPDIAVIDLLLAGTDSGWKAMELIRTAAPGAAVVVTSVMDVSEFPHADAHLPKPFTIADVQQLVDRLRART